MLGTLKKKDYEDFELKEFYVNELSTAVTAIVWENHVSTRNYNSLKKDI